MVTGAGMNRRAFLKMCACGGVMVSLGTLSTRAPAAQPLLKPISTSGEQIPAIGMGTWITFDVGLASILRHQRAEVLQLFFALGGRLIDSSPMYGDAEAMVGFCLAQSRQKPDAFTATKIWTWFGAQGPKQIATSRQLWGVETFDLLQVHNLLSWEEHLQTLRQEKTAGRVRYIGVTTSHGRRHAELEQVMRREPLDFVQLTYNILDREAEARLLPLAADQGIAVIANRPFRRKALFDQFQHHRLPDWAAEIDCDNWAQFFLKFIVSHPAVTCAIPATSQMEHMRENMGALYGRLPDEPMRKRMVRYVESL